MADALCFFSKKYSAFMLSSPIGFHHYILQNFNEDSLEGLIEQEVDGFDPPSEVRALIEGQLLSMRGHTERFGMPSPPKRIMATRGASANKIILRAVASIFGCDVYTVQRSGTLRAAHGWVWSKKGSFIPTASLYEGKSTSLSSKLAVSRGDQQLVSNYSVLMKKRMELENRLVQKLGRY